MFKIAVFPGDGIGPEVVNEGVKLLKALDRELNLGLTFEEALIGGIAVDKYGVPLPKETLDIALSSDAVLLGAVGGPKWDNIEVSKRPEQALLALRKNLGVFANIRPVKSIKSLLSASPIKPEIVDGVDLIILRELTGGIYFGEPKYRDKEKAIDTLVYHRYEIERIADVAFKLSLSRRRKITSVDKANILESSRLWREVINEKAKEYPQVTVEHLYVDNCAMQLIRRPKDFDVVLTENMFGDILSDEAGAILGSLGMLPSASIGEKYALYEPIHGSAPDIAGKGIANPLATILTVALLLRYSLKREDLASTVESAVEEILKEGYHTPDLNIDGELVNTVRMGDLVVERVLKKLEGDKR
ncbi:3-isopropylmalate dehydrogenase [bacterium]|nr:3-isopropylmalate dehydrogenase [bacterium]